MMGWQRLVGSLIFQVSLSFAKETTKSRALFQKRPEQLGSRVRIARISPQRYSRTQTTKSPGTKHNQITEHKKITKHKKRKKSPGCLSSYWRWFWVFCDSRADVLVHSSPIFIFFPYGCLHVRAHAAPWERGGGGCERERARESVRECVSKCIHTCDFALPLSAIWWWWRDMNTF